MQRMDTAGDGEDGAYWDGTIDINTLKRKIDIASGKLLYRDLAQCSAMT